MKNIAHLYYVVPANNLYVKYLTYSLLLWLLSEEVRGMKTRRTVGTHEKCKQNCRRETGRDSTTLRDRAIDGRVLLKWINNLLGCVLD
jgi:hypothetical protein